MTTIGIIEGGRKKMRKIIFRNKLVFVIFILLILVIFLPCINGKIGLNESFNNINPIKISTNSFQYNGSLLGYVFDPQSSPIENALVRVYFHGTYEENYSDENGFYHVTNIPICYCMKNCTCSKEGFRTEWILMGIVENTTHDFILTPIDLPVYPVIDGIIGDNGWYVSPVTISFVYDPDVVATIIVNGQVYTEPIVIDYEGHFYLIWYWIDYYGNESTWETIKIPIDFTLPILDITWEVHGCFLTGWEIWFIVTCSDLVSGLDRVEFYFADVLMQTVF